MEISPSELLEEIFQKKDIFILDIRTKEEFERGKIEGITSLNVPYLEILQGCSLNLPKNKKIIVVCAVGDTSDKIAKELKAYNLVGGMQAWNELYQVHIFHSEKIKIFQIWRVMRGCISYILASQNKAVIIDPLGCDSLYQQLLNDHQLTPQFVLDTHMHADHVSSGPKLSMKWGVPYFLHPYDAIHPVDLLPAKISYEPLSDNHRFAIGGIDLQILHTEGHTLGSVSLYINDCFLLTGDCLFLNSIGRPDLAHRLHYWSNLQFYSLKKVLQLPAETIILPGHVQSMFEANHDRLFYKTLKEIKKTNPAVAGLENLELFTSYTTSHLTTIPEIDYMQIKRINLGLYKPTEEELKVLESGKNCCYLL